MPLSPASTASALEGRTLADLGLHAFLRAGLGLGGPSQDQSWTLAALTMAALYYHPDISVARAKFSAAQADVRIASQRPNQSINLAAAFDTSAVAGAIPPGALPLTIEPVISFLVETFGKRQDRTARAEHLVEVARADIVTASWQVRGRVRGALIGVWAADRRLSLAEAQVAFRKQLVVLLEQRLVAGFATAPEVARERVAFAQAIIGTRDIERQQADARVQLAGSIGIPVRALSGVSLAYDAFDRAVLSSTGLPTARLTQAALTGRSDVQAALAQYEAAQSALKLAVAGQYPNISLATGYNYDAGTNRYLVSPTLELPIFNQNKGQIARAAADRQLEAARLNGLQAQIINAIESAVAAFRAATMTLTAADELVSGEEVRRTQARAAFTAGEADRPTLISTELEAAIARSSRFDAQVQQVQALGALEDAVQTDLFGDGQDLTRNLSPTEPPS